MPRVGFGFSETKISHLNIINEKVTHSCHTRATFYGSLFLHKYNMNTKNINILFCGAFRPVHIGHINMIHYWLKSLINGIHPTVHVIISKNDRDGITAQSSYEFLTGIFGKYPNFDCFISEDKSPVYTAYMITAEKKYGEGFYSLVSSTKNGDDKRSNTFVEAFAKGGRYETPGVVPMAVDPMVENAIYTKRSDDKNGLFISS